MRRLTGHIAGFQLVSGEEQVLIACPPEVIPDTGQYLLVSEQGAIQGTPLFLSGTWKQGFLAPKPYPSTWQLGTQLTLFGPLGQGFHLPPGLQRLALISLGNSISRLLPLLDRLKMENTSITIFSDLPLSDLSPALEAYPLESLPESITWADFFVVDSPLDRLDLIDPLFYKSPNEMVALRGQVLVHTNMPCCGIGKCGVCALQVNRSWKLACEDGPVFDLSGVLNG